MSVSCKDHLLVTYVISQDFIYLTNHQQKTN